jgi:Protein of unknown function (DUF5818)
MKRENSLLVALFFLAVAPLTFAQGLRNQPAPELPSDILGPQLIAWSQLQKPDPVSPPVRKSDHPAQDQSAQADQPPAQSSISGAQRQPAAQTVTGTIVKDGGRYILKASDNSAYQLDDQDRVKQYEGKEVRVAGTLDATGNSFHVTSIELIS